MTRDQFDALLADATTMWSRRCDAATARAEAAETALAAMTEREAKVGGGPMWCDGCRATGAVHCAHPDECGNMLSATRSADQWKAWLDDLPLPNIFDPAIGRLQDFITALTTRLDAPPRAEITLAAVTAREERLREALADAAGALDSAGAELSDFANILSRDPWQANHAYESALQARAALQHKDATHGHE